MMSYRVRLLLSASILSSALVGVSTAGAQTAPAGDQPPAETVFALETVVVTAQKRAENVQDVPISIEVVEGSRLEALQVNNFEALRNFVPNLQVQPSPGNFGVFVRGFGSGPQNNGFDQSVSLYVDGIYGGRIRQFMAPLFDVERVEVLRGPQGALFGKNTAAGAISIVTAGPTKDPQAELMGSYNVTRKGGELSGFVSGPLSDDVSARVAVKYTNLGGYIRNTALGTDDPSMKAVSARGTLRYEPSERFDVTAKLAFDDTRIRGKTGMQVSPANPVLHDVKASASPFGERERDGQNSYNASINANLALGDHVLTSVSGFSTFRAGVFAGGASGAPENWLGTYRDRFHQWSQEIRLASPTGKMFEYIVGGYWDTSDYDHYNASRYNIFGGTMNGQTHIDFSQKSETWSLFGQGTWNIADDLRVLGSLRYSHTKKDGTFAQFLDFGIPIATPRAFGGSLNESGVDPSITLQYNITPWIMAYATYGEGSKAGGFVTNTRTITASQFGFGPEHSRNYEAGFKSTAFSGRLLFNLTVFQTEFQDLQVAQFDPVASAFTIRNAASATSRGVETQTRFAVTDDLTLAVSAAYLDAKYDNFPDANCVSTGAVPPASTCRENLAGVVLPGASRWSGNVTADYKYMLDNGMKISALGALTFRSHYFTATDESPTYGAQNGWAKLDARLELTDKDDRWTVAVVGKNLTNELTQSFSYLWTLSTPAMAVQFLDETRMISLEGRVRF